MNENENNEQLLTLAAPVATGTVETQETARPRRPRTPSIPVRAMEELQSVDPKKMTDAERIKVIEDLRINNNLANNKVAELNNAHLRVCESYNNIKSAYDKLKMEQNAKMQYALDLMRLAYQSLHLANENTRG